MDPRKVERPPRLAERLLRASLPRGVKGLGMLGDLREDYYARVAAGRRSCWWFWREALFLSLRYMNITNDVRMAFRVLARDFSTTSIIILTLGAAMAASTVGFTFADLALLRGLPVDDGQRVVAVSGVDPRTGSGRGRLSPANYRDIKSRVTTLSHLAAFQNGAATIVERGIPTSLIATRTGADFFAAMGQTPFLGRLFQRGDDEPGAPGVVVLSHHYWDRVLGADRGVLGRSLLIDGRDHRVVGVASEEFEFGTLAMVDLWLPLQIPVDASRTERVFSTMGRLRDGVSLGTARAEIATIAQTLALEFPDVNREWRASVTPLADLAFGNGFWVIIVLFGIAVALIMTIASANAASLVLARAMARRREMALRTALGAGRWRLIRQAAVEGLVLSVGAVLVAVPLAELGLRTIRSVNSEPIFRQLWIDSHELGLLGIVALIAPILFSVLPIVVATRLDLRVALQAGGIRSGRGASRSRTALVALQLSLAVTLLLAAGLAVRTAVNLSNIDIGLRTAGVLTFGVDLHNPAAPVANPRGLIDEARVRLQQLPGVVSVQAFEILPVVSNERMVSMQIDGQPVAPGQTAPWALANGATAGALEAMGVRLVAGRWLTEQEDRRRDALVLLGETAAAMYFGSAPAAVGKPLTLKDRNGEQRVEVIGVASDVSSPDLERGPVPRVWTGLQDLRRVSVLVVAQGDPTELSGPVRREMAALAPMIPLEHLDALDTYVVRHSSSNQLVIGIFASFAGLALLLAATGLYGLITYTVGLRAGEFGTRFALGARPRDVVLLVAGQVGRLIGVGLAIGLIAGLAVGQGMRSVLYGVSATDPMTIAGVVGVMAAVALVASVRPAIRAARVNLADALRAE